MIVKVTATNNKGKRERENTIKISKLKGKEASLSKNAIQNEIYKRNNKRHNIDYVRG